MIRHTLTALTITLVATAAQARDPSREHLKQVLPTYGFKNVDVDSLSNVKVAHIRHLLHSNKSPAQIRGNIGATLSRKGNIFTK